MFCRYYCLSIKFFLSIYVNVIYTSASQPFFPRPTFCQGFALGPTFTENSIQISVIDIIANRKITKNNEHGIDYFFMRNLSLLIGYNKIESMLDRRKAHVQSSIQIFCVKTISFLQFRISYG